MGLFRMSLAGLMGIVALVAVEVAALRSAGDGWVDACRLLTASVLVLATFLARDRRGGERAFWFGFAVLGWATFVLVVDALAGSRSSNSVISKLPLLVVEATVDRAESNSYDSHLRTLRQLHILHLVLILPAGFIGGFVGWWADRRRRRHAEETA
jgi:hypothetical protein